MVTEGTAVGAGAGVGVGAETGAGVVDAEAWEGLDPGFEGGPGEGDGVLRYASSSLSLFFGPDCFSGLLLVRAFFEGPSSLCSLCFDLEVNVIDVGLVGFGES